MRDIQFGVIGNMGPEADTKFQDTVRKETNRQGAVRDEDHIAMIVVKNPDIPDTSAAIVENNPVAFKEIVASTRVLEKSKVQFAVMPCNTADYYRQELQKKTDILLVDMINAAVEEVRQSGSNTKVGILATTPTCNTGVYDQYLQEAQLDFYKPNDKTQEDYVHSAIYGIKTGEKTPDGRNIRKPEGIKAGFYDQNVELLAKAIEELKQNDVTTIILGCTELPLVRGQLEEKFPDILFIDPMEAVAQKVVKLYHLAQEKFKQLSDKKLLTKPAINTIKTDEDAANYIAVKAKVDLQSTPIRIASLINKRITSLRESDYFKMPVSRRRDMRVS